MKKRITTLLLCAAMLVSCVPAAGAAFTDISDEETALAAAALQGLGVVSGTTSTAFAPDSVLTRAQVCTMVVNAMGLSGQVNTYARKTLFSDVSPSAWYNGYVNLAYTKGVINGYGDGTFGPEAPISYGQMATILLRMLGYTMAEIGSIWPMDYTAFCADLGLSEGLALSDNAALTRGQAAVLLYRAIKEPANGSAQPYYRSVDVVASTEEVVLLDCAASYGGSTGLLMAYSLGNDGGVRYYEQKRTQSDVLNGSVGTLLFDNSGRVTGFIPESDGWRDVTIGSATASALTASNGSSLRISSDARVIAGGETYAYSTSGYLQLNQKAGQTVRLFYNEEGSVSYLYLTGGTASTAQAVVASTTSAASALARELGISGRGYSITKNGVSAQADDLAQYDVGYYDSASATLRVSDYRVSGFIESASPNISAAQTLTVAGHTFDVLECAWDSLDGFQLGNKVTLMLTDDNKVAAVYAASKMQAEMIGVLAQNGKSVTLLGSGVTLSAGTVECSEDDLGGLVKVSLSQSQMTCTAVDGKVSGKLDLDARTLGETELAPSCAVFEWGGKGYVYDLEGNQGTASTDFSAITWSDILSSSYVDYAHVNSAGKIDVLLLDSATGNCYQYGNLAVYIGEDGIDLGGGTMHAYNNAATLTNSSGTSGKYLCTISASARYAGIALGQSSHGYGRVAAIQTLSRKSGLDAGDFFLQGGQWRVVIGEEEFAVSDKVEIYVENANQWLSGETGLTAILADGYDLTLYYDRVPSEGGQIRIIVAG